MMKKHVMRILVIFLFAIIAIQAMAYATTTQTPMYMGLVELRTLNTPNFGYSIGNPSSTADQDTAMKLWNFVQYSTATSNDPTEGNFYCLKAGVGFTDTTGHPPYNVFFDMKTEQDQIKAQNDILAGLVEGTQIELDDGSKVDRYNAILAILDMFYLYDPTTDTTSQKMQLLNSAGIYEDEWDSILTEDEVRAVQQAALWYFTNYGEENGRYDKTSNTGWLYYVDDSGTYKNLADYNPTGVLPANSIGAQRQEQAEILYNYLIDTAKSNANTYESETSVAPAQVDTTSLDYSVKGDNYVIGPIHITQNNQIPYDIEMTVAQAGSTITDYVLLDENKSEVSSGKTVKDLVGKDFYISIPIKSGEVSIDIDIIYNKTNLTLWASTTNNAEQPIAIPEHEEITVPTNLTVYPVVTTLTVYKEWDDNDNQDGIRPEQIEVVLVKNGEDTTTTAILNEDNDWTYTFDNLQVRQNGETIDYSVREKSEVTGYTTTVTDSANARLITSFNYTITNIHIPEETSFVVNKTWIDNNNQDGIRPEEIEVVLVKDGEDTTTTATLNESNNWSYTFENLPVKENGTAIEYSVRETTVVDGYTTSTTKNSENNYTITNTLTAEKTFDLALRKYITSVNGTELTETSSRVPVIDESTLASSTTATYKHKKDPVVVQTGDKVIYKLTIYNEGERAGRATKIIDQLPTGLKFVRVVSGNFELDTYSEDDNRLHLKRVEGNEENLAAYTTGSLDSETIEIECEVTATATGEDKVLTNVTWISEEIDGVTNEVITDQEGKDRDSEPSTAPDVNKDNMENYTGNGNQADLSDSEYYYKGWQDDDDFEKLVIEAVTSVVVNKEWIDNNNQDGMRATEIEVVLVKDGEDTTTTATLNESNNWSYTFENLPVKENGTAINYSVRETTVVDGYTTSTTKNSENNYTITNTLTAEKTFDLALRKYITSINGTELTETSSRVPVIDESTLASSTTATYKHKKDPVVVQTGDKVIYKLTIYNEGERAGRATKIIDQLPTGLKFVRVVSGNFELDTYSEEDNRLHLKRVEGNEENLAAYTTGNLDSETIEIECEVTATATGEDKVLTNVAWISEEIDGVTNEVITDQRGKDRDSEPSTAPDVNKDNMENYTGNGNQADLSDSEYYYKGWQDDDDFEKLIIQKAEGTYNIQILKIDEENSNIVLSGAEFKITLADGTTQTLITNEQGIVEIQGINITEAGTQTVTIEELTAPEDYEKLIGTLTLEITTGIVNGDFVVTNQTLTNGATSSLEGNTIKVVVPNKEIEKPVDFKLIKRIVAVNNQNVPERIENVDVSKLNTIDEDGNLITTGEYTLNKEPVRVKTGDIVTYTFRVYNEGMFAGYVQEITEDIPEGLEFIWSEKEGEELEQDESLSEEEKEAIEFNKQYRWGNFVYDEDGEKIVQISSDYLAKENGDNLIPAFGENDGTKTEEDISYKEISVRLKVVAENVTETVIRNEAAITDDLDEDGEEADDRDSKPENWVKYEDDEDYDNIILEPFDLSLRKFIIAVSEDTTIEESEYLKNTDGTYTREPQVDTSKLNTLDDEGNLITTAEYNHTKEPLLVQKDSIVVYMLRVYNEGSIDGYAAEIKDHLPQYLEFVEGEFNEEYGWEVSEDGRTVTTSYLENELISEPETNENGELVLSYKEVPIMCKVKETAPTSKNITNIADITLYLDDNKEEVEDRDSVQDNVELPEDAELPNYKQEEDGDYIPGQEDDDDFEKIIIKSFDLALRKWVTQAIVIENGETSVTETGHQPYDDPEQIVKVELHRKKLNQVTVKFKYSIRVINEGELEGYAKEITDYIPAGLKFVAEDNKGWTDEGNNVISTKLLEDTLLQPGEYADVEVILTWENNSENMGVMINTAEISEDYNEYGVPDKDSTPDNKKSGEDDIDDAPVMLSISTGQMRIYFTLGFMVLITVAGGVVLIKKFVL